MHAHMIALSKRAELGTLSARTVWIVHSQYKGTVKSIISMAYSQASLSYISQQDDKMERVWLEYIGPRLEGFNLQLQ